MPLIQYLTVDKTLNYRIKAKVGEQQFALDVRVTIKFQNPKIVSLQIKCACIIINIKSVSDSWWQSIQPFGTHTDTHTQNPSISKP